MTRRKWGAADFVSTLLAGSFGAFVAYVGFTVNKWQFWVLITLFFAYGVARRQEAQ